jgi:ribosomal protein L19
MFCGHCVIRIENKIKIKRRIPFNSPLITRIFLINKYNQVII